MSETYYVTTRKAHNSNKYHTEKCRLGPEPEFRKEVSERYVEDRDLEICKECAGTVESRDNDGYKYLRLIKEKADA